MSKITIMSSVFFLFLLVNTCICTQQYHNSFRLLSLQNNSTKYTTTTISSTKFINNNNNNSIVHQAEIIKQKIESYVNGILIVASAIIGAMATLSSFVIFIIKCYKNSCKVKKSWFKLKSPSEYERRNICKLQRQIVLDEIIQRREQASSYIDEMV